MWKGLRRMLPSGEQPSPFTYEPLKDNEIRLLWLLPKDDKGQLQGVIEHSDLCKDEPYVCLSYVWGSPATCRSMSIGGRRFPLTLNLAKALDEIVVRPTGTGGQPIWIDAICINQQDDEEKSIQVQKMGLIYSRASWILAWLGEATSNSDLAIDVLSSFSEGDSGVDMDVQALQVILRTTFFQGDGTPTAEWMAVKDFFARSFWTRIWIVQEINLARRVSFLCGPRTIDRGVLRFSFMLLTLQYGSTRILEATGPGKMLQQLPSSPGFTLGFWGGPAKSKLKDGLKIVSVTTVGPIGHDRRKTATHTATDTRDYVYGLAGMVSEDWAELGIQADYRISCQQLYREVARALLEKRGDIDILSCCQFPRVTAGLPTWVPDWAMCLHPTIEARSDKDQFRVSGSVEASVSFPKDMSVLSIQGVKVGQVADMGPSWWEKQHWWQFGPKDPTLFDILDEITRLINIAPKLSAYATPKTQEDAVWRTAIRDCESLSLRRLETGVADRKSVQKRASEYLHESFQVVKRIRVLAEANGRTQYTGSPISTTDMQHFQDFRSDVEAAAFFKRLISVGGRYIGWAPWQVHVGDIVVIFASATVPFVLRPNARGFELVGEAYVHGIMYGEFMDISIPSWETIILV